MVVEWLLFGNVYPNERLGGLYMKYSIFPSKIIYKPRLVKEGGINMTVAYPVNFFSKNILALLKYMPGQSGQF